MDLKENYSEDVHGYKWLSMSQRYLFHIKPQIFSNDKSFIMNIKQLRSEFDSSKLRINAEKYLKYLKLISLCLYIYIYSSRIKYFHYENDVYIAC
jgi:hypothetical protein